MDTSHDYDYPAFPDRNHCRQHVPALPDGGTSRYQLAGIHPGGVRRTGHRAGMSQPQHQQGLRDRLHPGTG